MLEVSADNSETAENKRTTSTIDKIVEKLENRHRKGIRHRSKTLT